MRITADITGVGVSFRYAPTFYTCYARDNGSVPYAVSLTHERCSTSPPNLLKVLTPSRQHGVSSTRVNFTVCVTPLNNRYDNVRQLVEMIEVNRMYGAQHFIFYNYSSGQNVTRYLKDFYGSLLDVATVIPWPLPMPVEVLPHDSNGIPEVHYYAQVAALNDCLYRCINRRSTFAVFTDLDEIIVPRRRDSWTEMLEDVTLVWRQQNVRQFPGSYLFRNTFFRTDLTQDQTFANRGENYQNLTTLTTTEREQRVFAYFERSKYIVWSEAAITLGVHMVAESMSGTGFVLVDESNALLHHYRLWIDDPLIPLPKIVDKHMHKYADTIARRTSSVHRFMTSSSSSIAG
jgi:Glycosyltransferase family 92